MVKSQIRVLAIDDDAGVRANIAAYLEDSGYDIIEAENGLEGLEIFDLQQPDIVLVDLRMPGMGGLDFLGHLARRSPNTPAIVVSGAGVLEDAVDSLRQGAWDYVAKPITNMHVLEHAIAKCLERSALLRERDQYHERLEAEVRERTSELRKSYDDLRAYQAMVQEKNEFLRSLLESMPNPVFYKNKNGSLLGSNYLFTRLASPLEPLDVVGKKFNDIFPQPVAQVLNLAEDLLAHGSSGKCCEVDLPGPDNSPLRLAVYMSHFYDHAGVSTGVVGTFHDITDLKAKEAQILHQATHDELTGLLNRLGMRRHVESLIRDSGGLTQFAIIYLDVDNFKTINDGLGHDVGDRLLTSVTERLVSLFRGECIVCRPGGDEFLLVSLHGGNEDLPLAQAEAIQENFKTPFFVVGHEVFVQVSCGIAFFPEDGGDADTLVKNADLAMYKAKEQGGSSVRRYNSALTQRMIRRLELEKMLRKGLENNEFLLLYQPKVNLKTRRVVGMEALLRWSTSMGFLPPSEFVPVAEETGLIIELGEWILRQACRQHHEFSRQGLGYLRMSVNISAHQLQPDLPALVQSALDESGMPPHLLELEITESAMMRDFTSTTHILRELKERGVRIAIDDFGTGHSSLFYLKNFPVDTLKIDRSFVCDISAGNTDAMLVSSIVAMAKGLQLETVAEGVEYANQVDFLEHTGCTEVQGYFFSRPLSVDKFAGFVRDMQADAPEFHVG